MGTWGSIANETQFQDFHQKCGGRDPLFFYKDCKPGDSLGLEELGPPWALWLPENEARPGKSRTKKTDEEETRLAAICDTQNVPLTLQ